MNSNDVLDILRAAVPDAAIDERPAVDMPTVLVSREHIVDVCRVLRDHPALQFAFFADVASVDYFPANPRYEVVYTLACLGPAYASGDSAEPRRLRVKVPVPAEDPRVASVVPVFPAANWPEREIFDLMGIEFLGHPDLRRILMPEDWEGYPLRKDYPVQIRKDTDSWQPVQLSVEEFAANIRAEREAADRHARGGGSTHGE